MDDIKLKRFYQSFNLSSSDIFRLGGIPFVTVNSMAMEGDGCHICKEAEKRITSIACNQALYIFCKILIFDHLC